MKLEKPKAIIQINVICIQISRYKLFLLADKQVESDLLPIQVQLTPLIVKLVVDIKGVDYPSIYLFMCNYWIHK